jgi:hypothetical protein
MQVHAANRFSSVWIAEVEVLNVDPVVFTCWLAVVLVRMCVRSGEITVRVRMAVLKWIAFTAHV